MTILPRAKLYYDSIVNIEYLWIIIEFLAGLRDQYKMAKGFFEILKRIGSLEILSLIVTNLHIILRKLLNLMNNSSSVSTQQRVNILIRGLQQRRSHLNTQSKQIYIDYIISYLFQFYQQTAMQTVESTNRRVKGDKSREKIDYQQKVVKQQKFNNRYSLNQKAKYYDALKDPYTSYYFSNKGVKQHLKQLKKAIKFEPNLTEKNKLSHLITVRLKEKFQDVINLKTSIYERQLNNKDKLFLNRSSSKSFKLLTSKSKRKIVSIKDNNQKNISIKVEYFPRLKKEEGDKIQNADKINDSEKDNQNQQKQKEKQKSNEEKKKLGLKANKQKLFSDKLADELHEKKHQKWLQFLQQKRKMFIKGRPQVNK